MEFIRQIKIIHFEVMETIIYKKVSIFIIDNQAYTINIEK